MEYLILTEGRYISEDEIYFEEALFDLWQLYN